MSNQESIQHISAGEFDAVVLHGHRVVVDFYSDECPPCEALAPKFEALAEAYGEEITFVKIFRQQNRELALSLGVSSSPTVLFFEDGREVGTRLHGAIRRSELLAALDPWISPALKAKVQAARSPRQTQCDILVLGAGPAGLAAAIYGAQAKKSVIVVDKGMPGGQVATTHQVANYAGFVQPIAGFMLAHQMHQQAMAAGAQFRLGVDLTRVDLFRKQCELDGGDEIIQARKVILALGASYQPLGIAGEKEYSGRGISYCSTCDAKFYEGKEVIVIGGGDSALEEGMVIADFASRVRVMHRRDSFRAHAEVQAKAMAHPRLEFRKTAQGMMVMAENLANHEVENHMADGIFVFIGMRPNLELLPEGLALDEKGYIQVDSLMRTSIADVFAAGDIATKPFRQITVAVAEGTVAALQAAKEIGWD